MSTTAWTREGSSANAWTAAQGSTLIVKLNSGQSILRTIVTWGFGGYTWARLAPTSMQGLTMTLGACTTIGNGTETPPNPSSHGANVADPSQRWVYWSVRAPTCVVFDTTGNSAVWQSSPPDGDPSSKAQVLAPSGMGVGNTLNLWVTWQAFNAWDPSGQAIVWWSVETLVRSPL